MFRGFTDSLKGALVLFYMDKQINERALKNSPLRPDSVSRRKESSTSPSKQPKRQQYVEDEGATASRDNLLQYLFLFFYRESKVLKRTIQCCALNGGVFWASIMIFECGVLPFLKYLLTIVFGDSSGTGTTVWSWMKPFLSLTFGTIWVLPLFLLSRIVNSLWFQVNIASLFNQ